MSLNDGMTVRVIKDDEIKATKKYASEIKRLIKNCKFKEGDTITDGEDVFKIEAFTEGWSEDLKPRVSMFLKNIKTKEFKIIDSKTQEYHLVHNI